MVNTTARDMQLANGAVSRLILQTAGPRIQADANMQLSASGIPFGSVIETSGYNLPCRKVYHGACQNWDNGAGQCEEVSGRLFAHISCVCVSSICFVSTDVN